MAQRHLFIIDPIKNLNFNLDSSIRLAFESASLGAKIYFCEIEDLMWNIGAPCGQVLCQEILFKNSFENHSICSDRELLSLSDFEVVHMRKEPPIDDSFLTATWILDSAPKTTAVLNSPNSLRSLNEKLSIFQFPEFCDPAIVSNNPSQILHFILDTCNGDAILKPLHFFGGKGIFRLQVDASKTKAANKILQKNFEASACPILIQPFNKDIFAGEIRVFAAGGHIIEWSKKIPKQGNFLANTSSGATIQPYSPNEFQIKMVENIVKRLAKQGAHVLGMDIIGDKLSEINITSPRLLSASDDHRLFYKKIVNWVFEYAESTK